MIGTPCYDGRLDVWYTNSLCDTIKQSYKHNVEIIPMWISFDALLQRARNDTIHLALELDVDDLIWIDSDIEWQPDWFFKLLDYPEDVVGGTYPKKSDIEQYVFRTDNLTNILNEHGLLEMNGLGTGFVKMSKVACQSLWDSSITYLDPKDNKERRMVFDVAIENINGVNCLVSEDINAFNKLQAAGFKIWLDPNMTCNHTGPKKYTGNFTNWLTKYLFKITKDIKKQL